MERMTAAIETTSAKATAERRRKRGGECFWRKEERKEDLSSPEFFFSPVSAVLGDDRGVEEGNPAVLLFFQVIFSQRCWGV